MIAYTPFKNEGSSGGWWESLFQVLSTRSLLPEG